MKTIEITSGKQKALFTTRSVTFDGKEFFYSKMSNVTNNAAGCFYIFTYNNEVKTLPYESKDSKILEAIFSQVQNLPHPKATETANTEQTAAAADMHDVQTQGEPKSENTVSTEHRNNICVKDELSAEPEISDEAAEEAVEEQSVDKKAARKAERERRKAEKERRKAEKREEKERKKAEKDEKSKVEENIASETEEAQGEVTAEPEIKKTSDAIQPPETTENQVPENANKPDTAEILEPTEEPKEAQESEAHEVPKDVENTEEPEEAKDTVSEDEIAERKNKLNKSLIIFGIIIAVIFILSFVRFFIFGTNKEPSPINPNSTETTETYNDIDELINDLQ